MEAVTWTALGVLAAFSLGVLALHASHGSRFDSVNARIDAVNDRIAQTATANRAELRETRDDLRREIRGLGDRLERGFEEHQARHHG